MANRVKELEQLFILEELPENKMYTMVKAHEEIERLAEVSINNMGHSSSSKARKIT